MSNTRIPSITFEVTRVEQALDRLPEVSLRTGLAALLSRPQFGNASTGGTAVPAVEACSEPDSKILKPKGYHPLIAAVHCAFAEHRPLTLSPDMIWLTIVQGFATHINMHAEKYREHFVTHEGRETIEVVRNEFIRGSADNAWENVFSEFSDKIRDYVGNENHDLLVADFSTTGPIERAASEVALMDSMQSYFEFLVSTRCGIPNITLEGTLADWQALHTRVESLYRYPDLEWWLDKVKVVTKNFVSAYEGRANFNFWQSFYKVNDMSGGPFIDGWLMKLLPYLKGKDGKATEQNPLLEAAEPYRRAGITHDQLPGSLSIAPFTWDYFGDQLAYEFIAGVVGVTQDERTRALRPKIGWAVRPAPTSEAR